MIAGNNHTNRKVTITGWGQVTQPLEQIDNLLDPLGLMVKASRRAAESLGSLDILAKVDGIMVVRPLSRHYDDAAKQLAEKIGAAPRFNLVSGVGGNSPQSLVNKAGGMIARGELESVLLAGGETYCPRNKSEIRTGSDLFKGLTGGHERQDMLGAMEIEMHHGVYLPIHGFPLYETALWAESGLDLEPYMERVGNLWRKFSQAASTHPNAWIKSPLTPSAIVSATRNNRMIAFPYTKFMTSMLYVDLGAAIILMSEEKSRQFYKKDRQPVYFLAGAHTEERQPFLIQKSNFTSSLPLKAAAQRALCRSNLTMEEIDCFDIYSCFPSSVAIACKMLGIKETDKRPLTLTGGLGFFGGPGNNYSLHAVVTLADALSRGLYKAGMITSLGWFLQKHAVGIYSTRPVNTELYHYDLDDKKSFLVGEKPVKTRNIASGKGIIETYTVIYSRDGSPAYAVIYGKTSEGFRFISQTHADPDIFDLLTSQNQVGRLVHLKYNAEQNLNIAELL
ncbi:MAG: hypothetical protein WA081_00490 [Desulfosalsimonadaceae bacterium]